MTGKKLTIMFFSIPAVLLFFGCGEGSGDDESDVNSDVVINEVLSKSSAEVKTEWIELYNKSNKDVDISNWSICDSKDRDPFIIPEGTVIKKGGFFVADYDETGENGFSFGLGSDDKVRLFNENEDKADSIKWDDGDMVEDQSYGRVPDGTGEFKLLISPTKGKSNSDTCGNGELDSGEVCDGEKLDGKTCADLYFGSGTLKCYEGCAAFDTSECVAIEHTVVINELAVKLVEEDEDLPDWIELYNTGTATDISGWQIKDSNDDNIYTFPEDTVIEKNGYLVINEDELDFGFGSEDAARLFDKAGNVVDETEWAAEQAPENKSWGRIPNGTGDFQTIDAPTEGSENK